MQKRAARRKQPVLEYVLLTFLGVLIVIAACVLVFLLMQRSGYLPNGIVNNAPVAVASPTLAVPTNTPLPAYTPVIENTPCQFTVPEDVQVTCGFVIVPEDRAGNVADTIRVAFAIYHSLHSQPQPDPVLYLQGGPGAKAIDWSSYAFPHVIVNILNERDFIVFDPRGVGYSQPAFECDEFRQTYLQDVEGRLPDAQRASYYEGALLTCKNKLTQAGINLSAYTSTEIAADAVDLVTALGYEQVNLYGISYGTRIGQLIMRDRPGIVRSAILDSVVPIETLMLDQGAANQEAALQHLFDQCQADAQCATAYPDLQNAYHEVVAQLNAQPLTMTFPISANRSLEQEVNGWTFRNTLVWSLRSPETIALIPLLIQRTRNGDTSLLKYSLVYPLLSFDSISVAMYISVNCHDQVFAMSTEQLDQTIFDMCKLWDTRPLKDGENSPVVSDIPTLILAGTFDPVTPPSFGKQVASHLTHAYMVEIADQGHSPSSTGVSDCPRQLIASFLKEPNVTPDASCMSEIRPVKFSIPYVPGTALQLAPMTVEQYQLTASLPVEWTTARYGFRNRNAWTGDMTQLGTQRADVSAYDWTVWLSTNFAGRQGFDQMPTLVGERKANGLTWLLYKATSKGLPVEMAFAKTSQGTLMVLLISYPDEHDALYEAVFLPAVDSTVSTR